MAKRQSTLLVACNRIVADEALFDQALNVLRMALVALEDWQDFQGNVLLVAAEVREMSAEIAKRLRLNEEPDLNGGTGESYEAPDTHG